MGLLIEAQEDTPFVELDDTGKIHIEGRSLPENVSLFYKPVLNWLKNYLINPAPVTHVYIFLTYYNSSSFKCINDILYNLNMIIDKSDIHVDWVFEEDDQSIYETGKELQAQLDIQFNVVEQPVTLKKNERLKIKNLVTGKVLKITRQYWNLIVRNGHQKDFQVLDQ